MCAISFPVVVLHGFGGVGKTTIARKICQLTKGSVIWIDSEKEEFILQGFAKLIGSKIENKAKIQEALKNVFSLQFKMNECLFLFDNVNNYKMLLNYLPLNLETKTSVLITSNSIWDSCDYGEVKHIPVEKFTTEEFSEFVKKIIKDASELEIRELDKYTGRFPYLANIVCYGFAKWRRLIPGREVEEYLKSNGSQITNADFIIYTKTDEEIVEKQMNLMKIYYEEDGAVAYQILCMLAYCQSDFYEYDLLSFAEKYKPLQLIVESKDIKILKNAVKVSLIILIEQGFVENTWSPDSFSIHRSHQKAVRYILKKLGKELELIKNLLDCDKDYYYVILNIKDSNLLWNCGKSYGDEILDLMINNKNYINYIMRSCNDDKIKEMAEFARRTKSNDEYARWAIHELGLLERYKVAKDYEYLFDGLSISNFSSLLSGLKAEEKDKIYNLIWFFAAKKKEWLAEFFKAFPEMLHDKEYFSIQKAIVRKKLIALEFLIQAGFDVNERGDFGWRGLDLATYHCNVEAAEMLLKAGADPNLQNMFGDNSLHYLLLDEEEKEEIELLNLLLKYSANPNIKDNDGKIFIERAKEKGFEKFVQIVERHVNK